MKALILLLFIQFFAYQLAFAAEEDFEPTLTGMTLAEIQQSKLEDCQDTLPKLESQVATFDEKFSENARNQRILNDLYTSSFNSLTATLFEVTEEQEKETAETTAAKNSLKESIQVYNAARTVESSKQMEQSYTGLAEKIYSAVSSAQNKLNKVREAYALVEKTRSEYQETKLEMDGLESEKLSLQSQIASMKVRCQKSL
jgi:chromosome segregation ATPase